jgi:uncharacterized membrane protein YidH (DUF202 family)
MIDNIETIVQQINSRPTDQMALGRTIMACQRTFLSHIRTSVGFLGGGIGIIMYLEKVGLVVIGFILIVSSIIILGIGVLNYLKMRKMLTEVYKTLKLTNS